MLKDATNNLKKHRFIKYNFSKSQIGGLLPFPEAHYLPMQVLIADFDNTDRVDINKWVKCHFLKP